MGPAPAAEPLLQLTAFVVRIMQAQAIKRRMNVAHQLQGLTVRAYRLLAKPGREGRAREGVLRQ